MNKEISISKGNIKLGNIWNISLPPIKSCYPNLPCYKKCYARKAYRAYPSTKKAWDKNYNLFKTAPGRYFQLIDEFLNNKNPEYFRWFVAGDCPNKNHLLNIIKLSNKHLNTKFMMFTKRYDLLLNNKENIPSNLSINVSAWNGLTIPNELRKKYRIAWFLDPKNPDYRIKKVKNIIHCPGSCKTCKVCWHLSTLKKDVLFIKH